MAANESIMCVMVVAIFGTFWFISQGVMVFEAIKRINLHHDEQANPIQNTTTTLAPDIEDTTLEYDEMNKDLMLYNTYYDYDTTTTEKAEPNQGQPKPEKKYNLKFAYIHLAVNIVGAVTNAILLFGVIRKSKYCVLQYLILIPIVVFGNAILVIMQYMAAQEAEADYEICRQKNTVCSGEEWYNIFFHPKYEYSTITWVLFKVLFVCYIIAVVALLPCLYYAAWHYKGLLDWERKEARRHRKKMEKGAEYDSEEHSYHAESTDVSSSDEYSSEDYPFTSSHDYEATDYS